MPDTLTIDDINDLIEKHSDGAKEAVMQLADYCQQDERCRTPLNVAIQSHNHDIIGVIAGSAEAVNFFPSIADDLRSPAKHSVSAIFLGDNVEETEKYLVKSFGPHTCWQRTPLHTACRHADADAIVLLISKNAHLDAKDIMGLSPLELCLHFCDADVIDRFISCCVEYKRKLSISEQALQTACAITALYDKLLQCGTLNATAKRFAFSRACALLDKKRIEALLAQGLDINKTMNDEFSPIMEICTSRLLYLYEHPDAPRLAGQHAAAQDPGAGGIQIDNDDVLKAESLEEIEALFSNSLEDVANNWTKQASYDLTDKERRSQLQERLELIDYLVEQGMDTGIAQEKAPFAFVDHVASMNSPEILQALVHNGFSLSPEQDYEDAQLHTALTNEHFAIVDPLLQLGHQWKGLPKNYPELVRSYQDWRTKHEADVVALQLGAPKSTRKKVATTSKAIRKSKWTWELAGESMLLAETDPKSLTHRKPFIVRITHNNVYGPVDDAQLYVRIGDPDMPTPFDDHDGDDDWHPLELVEELLSVDGDEVDRSSLNEPVYGETPWDGTYECKLKIAPGKQSIEIKVVSEVDGMAGVISDWIVNVK